MHIIESNARCHYILGYIINLDLTKFCAEAISGNSCQGDSRGPLMCVTEEDIYTLCGVVSGGNGRCSGDKPSFFMRTTQYRDWIIENTEIEEEITVSDITTTTSTTPTTTTTTMTTTTANVNASQPQDFLMIIGGENYGGNVDTVELMSLTSAIPECLKSRGSFPSKLSGAVGAFLEGRIIVCGGYDGTNPLSTCWAYDTAEDKWGEYGRMREARYFSAAALNDRYGWVISGGYGNDGRTSSVEHSSDGRNFENLPSMPIRLWQLRLSRHCLVSLDGDEDGLFVTGGYPGNPFNKRTFIYKNGSWNETESMPTAREYLMCGPVQSQPGGPVEKIVVAGGIGGVETVEVYNVQENSWETADDLPFGGLLAAAVIPFEDTFIMIGGYGSNGYSDKLWRYKKSGEWEEMPNKLMEGKQYVAAIGVPSDIFPSC